MQVIQRDFLIAGELVYKNCGFSYTPLRPEPEGADYGAGIFEINALPVIWRVAKITPAKTGQFVTLWKRGEGGITQPFDLTDDFAFYIINARNDEHFGQFIFPKYILVEKGILSSGNKNGKRGIRVYPPWDQATNKQAQKTQQWQLDYFLEIPKDKPAYLIRAKTLFIQ